MKCSNWLVIVHITFSRRLCLVSIGLLGGCFIWIRSSVLDRLLGDLLLLLLSVIRRSSGLLLLGVVLLLLFVLLLLHGLLVMATHLHVFRHLGNHAHLLLSHHLEVSVFGSLDLTINSINLKLIGVNLTLVILELSDHLLKLLGALLQVLLVLDKLLSDFRPTLLGQNVLQLNVKLLFLLDKHIFLRDFLSLRNEPLLKRLDLLDELVGLNIRRLKLSPSVDVEGLAEFILQELSLLLLFEQLLLKQVDFASQVREAVGLILRVLDFTLELSDLLHKFENVISLLLVVDATLAESTLLNLNLFVQEQEFLITLDELSSQNITLVDNHLVVLALLLFLSFGLSDDIL